MKPFQFAPLIRTASALLLACGVALAARAEAPVRVATVLYVAGQVEARAQAPRPLKAGDAVFEGDLLQTGSDGHLYLRTVDQGFFSLRPETRVHVETYRYDTAEPSASRIRLNLHSGVMRAVSGRAAQAARDKYRLETPVAAIGLRGTDYTVFTNAETTRVSVQSGGVVVGALGQHGCTAGAFGPCSNGAAVELAASQADKLVEVQAAAKPRLLEAPAQSMLRPERISPPLPNEKTAAGELLSGKPAAPREDVVMQERESWIGATLPPPAPAAPEPEPLVSSLRWGRWAAIAKQNPGTPIAELIGDSTLIGLNSLFALGRTATPDVPANGTLSFKLDAYEAYLTTPKGKVLAAGIENGYLDVDAGNRRFKTGFDLTVNNDRFTMYAPGSLTRNGRLVSDVSGSGINLLINGTLGTDAREAAYLFTGQAGSAGTATGATYWTR